MTSSKILSMWLTAGDGLRQSGASVPGRELRRGAVHRRGAPLRYHRATGGSFAGAGQSVTHRRSPRHHRVGHGAASPQGTARL